MSRTQWRCLLAVLAVVLGLLCGPAATAAATAPERGGTEAAGAPVDGNTGIPGCDRNRDHDGQEPGAPARSRSSHDQAPGLAAWGLSGATGRGPAHPLVRATSRGLEPATRSPVELSVLRV